jgi:hypothetical protein
MSPRSSSSERATCNLAHQVGVDSRRCPPAHALRRRRPRRQLAPGPGRGDPRVARTTPRVGGGHALRQAEVDLTSEAEAIGSAPEDAAMIEEVEARTSRSSRPPIASRRSGRRTFVIGGACAGFTLPGCTWPVRRVLFMAIAWSRGGVAAGPGERRTARTSREQALEDAGANSYLGFQLQRVNGCWPTTPTARPSWTWPVPGARASAEWQQLAGDIPVEWALSQPRGDRGGGPLRREVDALARCRPRARPGPTTDRRPGPRAHQPAGRGALRGGRRCSARARTTRSATSIRR